MIKNIPYFSQDDLYCFHYWLTVCTMALPAVGAPTQNGGYLLLD